MIIDLATFNINTDQLFQKLTQTRTEIEKLKAQQKELQKEFINSNKSVADNQKKLDDLNKELQGLTRGTATYNETLARRDVAERELNASLLQQAEVNARYQTQLTQTRLEINQLSNQARSYETVLNTQNRATNESIDLYTRQRAELSLLQREQRELGAQIIELERNGQRFSKEWRELSRQYAEASDNANELATSLRQVDQDGGNFSSNIGNYKSVFDGFKDSLLSGDIKGAIGGITESFKKLFGSLLVNPIGAVITALAGIGLAAKAVFDFNDGIKESNTLLKGLGVASGDISKVRTELEATAETYGKSFDEIAKTANSLAKSYGISISEANDIIAKGLTQGGATNEDFLKQISEYDVQFAKLGFTAEESLNLINAGFAEGVYNDKLPDTIKEIGLSLEEMTEPAKKALENAFGKEFTETLSRNVGSGVITTKEALKQIDEESKKANLSTQQQAQLTADIFKGAGEDAGGTLKVLELLRNAQNKQLTESQKAVEDLRRANERLNKVQAGLFEIEDFGSVWANIKAQAINFFVDTIEYVNKLLSEIQPLVDFIKAGFAFAWELVKAKFVSTKNAIVAGLKFISDLIFEISVLPQRISNAFITMKNVIINAIQSLVSVVKPLLSALGVDVDSITKSLNGLKGKTVEIKKETKNVQSLESKGSGAVEKVKADKEAELDRIEAEKLKKLKAEQDKKNADANNKKLAEAQKAKEDAQKKLEEEIKNEIASAQKLADEKVKLANIELNAYIEKNKSILENEKYLTSELLKQENERLKNIEKAKLDQEKLEFDTSNKILNDKITAFGDESKLNQTQANELATLKLQQKELEVQYNSDVAKIKEETQKGITASETRYSNERIEAEKTRKAIQYQTELLELELKGATEAEIKTAQLEQQKEIEVTKLIETADAKIQAGVEKRLEEDELITQEQALKAELEAELQNTKDENERIRVQNQLDTLTNLERNSAKQKQEITNQEVRSKIQAYGNMFANISALFGEETAVAKAAGIAQAGINTYLGVTNVLADKTVPSFIKPIVIATTIATGLQSVAKISGIKGFADGGLVNGGVEISRSNGDNRLVTVKDGEVILNESQQRALGGSNVFKAIGVPGFASGGVVGGISNLQNIQTQFTEQLNTELLTQSIREAVIEGSTIGTATGSQQGISDLSTSNIISNGANF